jgi:predicted transcriptional regulator
MGQYDILEFINGQKNWVTPKEIQKRFNINRSAISRCLRRLVKCNVIEFKEERTSGMQRTYLFKSVVN